MKIIPTKATLYIFLAIILESLAALITFELSFWELEREQILEFFIPLLIPICIVAYFLGQKINFQGFPNYKTTIISILILFGLLYLYILMGCFWLNIQREWIEWLDVIVVPIFLMLYTTLFGGIQTILIGLGLGYILNKSKKQSIESKK